VCEVLIFFNAERFVYNLPDNDVHCTGIIDLILLSQYLLVPMTTKLVFDFFKKNIIDLGLVKDGFK